MIQIEHSQENNSLKITIELALKSNIDLRGADLRGADLRGADILCIGNMKEIFTMQIDNWMIGFTKDVLQIGCQKHPIEKWRNFTDKTINEMAIGSLEWWGRWKTPLFAIIDERLKDL